MVYEDFLETVIDCPFCGSSRQYVLIENDSAFMTYSISPSHEDHILVVPKRHIERILDLTENEIKDIDSLQMKGFKLLHKIGYTDVSFMVRDGNKAGKSVPHLHYHLIPNVILGDVNNTDSERRILTKDETDRLIKKFQSVI